MKTITEIYYKMKPFTGNSCQLVLILKTLSDHIFGGERWSTMNCVLTLVHLRYYSHTFQGIIKASSGICVLTSISIFSNLVECVDFSDLSTTEGWFISFFRINNIKLKSSFVRCRKYHKSR